MPSHPSRLSRFWLELKRRRVIHVITEAIKTDPGNYFAYNLLDIMAFYCNEYDRAIETVQFFMPFENEVKNNISKVYAEQGFIPAYEVVMQQLENLYREGRFALTPFDMAARYYMLGEYNNVIEWIETGYEIHDPNAPYVTTNLLLQNDELIKNSRFADILKKMNLPLAPAN